MSYRFQLPIEDEQRYLDSGHIGHDNQMCLEVPAPAATALTATAAAFTFAATTAVVVDFLYDRPVILIGGDRLPQPDAYEVHCITRFDNLNEKKLSWLTAEI
jgi:hypothetical protein